MRKIILIPTDFTVHSLTVLKAVLSTNSFGQTFDIILLHGLNLNDSISDLLFFSKSKHIDSLKNIEFEEAYEVLRNKFASQINSLRIDLFMGYNLTSFNNYLEANKIDAIITSDKKPFLTTKNSFDLSQFIHKCPVTVITIPTDSHIATSEKGKFLAVFNPISMD